jgi:hypothetical protein
MWSRAGQERRILLLAGDNTTEWRGGYLTRELTCQTRRGQRTRLELNPQADAHSGKRADARVDTSNRQVLGKLGEWDSVASSGGAAGVTEGGIGMLGMTQGRTARPEFSWVLSLSLALSAPLQSSLESTTRSILRTNIS